MCKSFEEIVEKIGTSLKGEVIAEAKLWDRYKSYELDSNLYKEATLKLEEEYNVTVLIDDAKLNGYLSNNIFSDFIRQIKTIPILSDKEEYELLKKYRETKDKDILNRVVEGNYRLVLSIVNKYNYPGIEAIDLFQEGVVGLIHGIEKFDIERGYRLSTYATHWIRQGITRYIAQYGNVIRLPVWLKELFNKEDKFIKKYSVEHNGELPSDKEVASFLDIPLFQYKMYKGYRESDSVASLNTQVTSPNGEESTELGDYIPSDVSVEDEVIKKLLVEELDTVLSNILPEREEKILRLRWGMDGTGRCKSLQECSTYMGVTRERVRQLESRAIGRIKYSIKSKHLVEYLN